MLLISDFGCAFREAVQALEVSRVSGISGQFGTDLYRPPETFKRLKSPGKTKPGDVFSMAYTLGDLLNESVGNENLYGLEALDMYQILITKTSGDIPKFKIPQVCQDSDIGPVETALNCCLDNNPEKRLSASDLHNVMHAYYSSLVPNLMKSPEPKKNTAVKQRTDGSLESLSSEAKERQRMPKSSLKARKIKEQTVRRGEDVGSQEKPIAEMEESFNSDTHTETPENQASQQNSSLASNNKQQVQKEQDAGCQEESTCNRKEPSNSRSHEEKERTQESIISGNKLFLDFHTDCYTCQCIDLRVSQATPGIMITFGDQAQVDYTIPEVRHLKLLLENETRVQNLKRFEATNACAFYSTLIMNDILLRDDWSLDEAVTKSREIMMHSQLDFNHLRSVEKTYSVEEAIKILGKKILINLRHYDDLPHGNGFLPADEKTFKETLLTFFTKVEEVLTNIKYGFFYTVGELVFSFVVNYKQGTATLIDTHQLPHIENAVICRIRCREMTYTDRISTLAGAMTKLLQKRIEGSLGHRTYSVYHQVDIAAHDEAPSLETSQDLLQESPNQDTEMRADFELNFEDLEESDFEGGHQFSEESQMDFQYDAASLSQDNYGLRDYQQEVLKHVQDSIDCLLVWPTAAGKTHTILSIIEQRQGTAIITTPTLALMLEYIKQLEERSITYAYASSLQNTSSEALIVEICQKSPRCILTTHEYLCKWGEGGLNIINQAREIDLIVFDEVHLEILWGPSFRTQMLEVHNLLDCIAHATRVALTATPIGGDIQTTIESARLRSPFVSRRSLFRPNIKLNVFISRDAHHSWQTLLNRVSSVKKSIIFTSFVETANTVAAKLKEETELEVGVFTGRKSTQMKTETFKKFEDAEAAVIVATSALGD